MEKVVLENKKDVIPAETKRQGRTPSPIATIRVIKAHDGLAKGAELKKPRKVAEEMAAKGYWEIIK
jgi:hypothetical protein